MDHPCSWAAIGDDGACTLRVKAVPGAKRDEISGVWGEGEQARLKIRVSAPPEGGKANKAICTLIARSLGVRQRDVAVVSGQTNPEKTLRIEGVDAERVRALLN